MLMPAISVEQKSARKQNIILYRSRCHGEYSVVDIHPSAVDPVGQEIIYTRQVCLLHPMEDSRHH